MIEKEKKEGRKIDSNYNNKIFLSPSQTLLQTPLRLASGFLRTNHKILISNWSNEKLIIKENALLGYASTGIYEAFSIDIDNDDEIYIPSPINNDLNEITQNNKSFTKEQFIQELNKLLNNNNLNETQKTKLTIFLTKWKHLFAFDPKNPGATTKTKCFANTQPNTQPIRTHHT